MWAGRRGSGSQGWGSGCGARRPSRAAEAECCEFAADLCEAALAVAPTGFTVAEFTAKARAITGRTPEDYSIRQGAYDLRKLRGKQLVIKPGRTRRYQVPS